MLLNDVKRMLSMLIWLAITTPLLPFVAMVMEVEDPDELTCYTCAEASSNFLCNKYAVDRPCSIDRSFCQTIHEMDSGGTSVSVMKRCVTAGECSSATVGCTPGELDGGQRCVSCCDVSYCNEFAPTNVSSAVYLNTRNGSGGGSTFAARWPHAWILLALVAWTIWGGAT